MNLDEDKLLSAHIIIHASSTSAAIVAGAAANIPIIGPIAVGNVVLTGISTAMVIAVGDLYQYSFQTGAVLGFAGQILGVTLGASLLKTAFSLIPGVGTVSNAVVTFGVTESIGWAAYLIFREGKDITLLGQDELRSYMDQGTSYAANAKAEFAWLDQLPPHIKAQYDYLTRKLTNAELSEADRRQVLQEAEELIRPYKPVPSS